MSDTQRDNRAEKYSSEQQIALESVPMLTQMYSNLTIAFRTTDKEIAKRNPEIVARLVALLDIDIPPEPRNSSGASVWEPIPPLQDASGSVDQTTNKNLGKRFADWFAGTPNSRPQSDRVVLPERFQWVDAYEAEALLAHLHTPPKLLVELQKAARRARSRHNDQTLYKDEVKKLEDAITNCRSPDSSSEGTATKPVVDACAVSCARALLVQLVMAQNWEKSEKHLKRGFGLRFSKRMAWVAPIVVIVFLIVLWLLPALRETFVEMNKGQGFLANLANYAGLITVATAGVMGAAFSRLITPVSSFENQTLASAILFSGRALIAVRLTVGGIAAIVLYFFFEAGFFEGLLFPDLEMIGFQSLQSLHTGSDLAAQAIQTSLSNLQTMAESDPLAFTSEELTEIHTALSNAIDTSQSPFAEGGHVPNADLSKLLAWSFLAGFSEQLVTKMLNRLENGSKSGSSSGS